MREARSRQLRIRRMRYIRRCVLLSLLLVFLCVAGVVYSKIVVGATSKQKSTDGLYKYYAEVRVHRDDTLWSIANDYFSEGYSSLEEFMQEIREINSISFNKIYYGQLLIVPYYSEEFR